MKRDLVLLQHENNFRPATNSSVFFEMPSFDDHREGVSILAITACTLMMWAVFCVGDTAGRINSISIIVISLISILIIGFILIYGNPKRLRRVRHT